MGKITIGLALGSGAAHGIAHIGVIRALEENGIYPNVIAGSSIGAVVGGLYATGLTVAKMEKAALEFGKKRISYWMDPSFFRRGGLLKGDKIEQALEELTGPLGFDELRIPFYALASDLVSGKEIVLDKGDLVKAIRASFAIPGIFAPVKINDRWLIDGATVEPVPTKVLHDKKCDVIIAVNVMRIPETARTFSIDKEPKILDVLMQALISSQQRMAEPCMKLANIRIAPDMRDYDWTDFRHAGELIEIGYDAAMSKMSAIKKKVSLKKKLFFFKGLFGS